MLMIYFSEDFFRLVFVHFYYFFSRAFKIIEEYFERVILEDQEVLKDEQEWSKVLDCIPDDGEFSKSFNKIKISLCNNTDYFTFEYFLISCVRNRLNEDWKKNPSRHSVRKWEDLVRELDETKEELKEAIKAKKVKFYIDDNNNDNDNIKKGMIITFNLLDCIVIM